MKTALLSLLLSGVVFAQTAPFDFTQQDIAADLTGAHPSIEITLTAIANRSVDRFDFLIPPGTFEYFSVNGMQVQPTPHPQYPTRLWRVTFATLVKGQSAEFRMAYKGPLSCQIPNSPLAQCVSSPESTMLYPLTYEMPWYFQNFYADADPNLSKVTVRVPQGHTAIAGQGAATVTDLAGGGQQWTYAAHAPTESQFIATGVFRSVQASSGGHTVKAYFPSGMMNEARQQSSADLSLAVWGAYSTTYGQLPITEIHLVAAPRSMPAGGMGMLGNVLLADDIFFTHTYLLDQGIAHEMAHSWWGNLSSGVFDEMSFMSEAFAEYSGWRALGELRGPAERARGMRMNAVWYMYRTPAGQDVAPLSTDVAQKPGFVYVTYHKGPVVLRMLEEQTGTTLFTSALQALIARGYGQTSMARLADEVSKLGGPDLTAEIDRWLRHTGFARVKVTPRRDADGVKWQTQCEGVCPVVLPVRVRLPNGDVIASTLNVSASSSENLVSGAQSLESIELDPEWTAVREITCAQPNDVTLDGTIDGRDLLEVALRVGGSLPSERRIDGAYDPLYDVNGDRMIDAIDAAAVLAAVQ